MKENVKNEVVEEVEVIDEIEEETKEGFLTKAKGWVKRNGKKVAIAAAGTVGLGLAYALGKKSSEDSEEFIDDEIDSDSVEDADFTEVESE